MKQPNFHTAFHAASKWMEAKSLRSCVTVAGSALVVVLSGCAGAQSTFANAGEAAQSINGLLLWMVLGAVVIWCVVVGIAIYASLTTRQFDRAATARVIVMGGAIFPTLVLTGLLSYGLAMIPQLQAPAPDGSVTIEVAGVRWWWRIKYVDPPTLDDSAAASNSTASLAAVDLTPRIGFVDRPGVVVANEIVLPVNEPVEFKLTSEDVIHAFWIPALGGKVDMIPGRQTRLKLLPLKIGEFRGVCAEYCGEAHTQMAFTVKVVSREEFDLWLAAQREPARTRDAVQAAGLELFLSRGCGACHAIRGTAASGVVGPDLTHVGSRGSIGAGWLPNNIDNFRYWLRETKSIKPGVEMPQFDFLSEAELQLLAEFMEGLQ